MVKCLYPEYFRVRSAFSVSFVSLRILKSQANPQVFISDLSLFHICLQIFADTILAIFMYMYYAYQHFIQVCDQSYKSPINGPYIYTMLS